MLTKQAQTNLTLLNEVVWGTCNTDLSSDVCTANMAWFASELQTECATDLKDENAMAVDTLQGAFLRLPCPLHPFSLSIRTNPPTGLNAFPLMLTAGCLADQLTNTYCYVEAAHSSSPSDLFFYQLPQGLPLPNGTAPSCSSCVKSLMGAYASALGTNAAALGPLGQTYGAAEKEAVAQCGEGYAQATTAVEGGAANGAGRVGVSWAALMLVLAAVCSWL